MLRDRSSLTGENSPTNTTFRNAAGGTEKAVGVSFFMSSAGVVENNCITNAQDQGLRLSRDLDLLIVRMSPRTA